MLPKEATNFKKKLSKKIDAAESKLQVPASPSQKTKLPEEIVATESKIQVSARPSQSPGNRIYVWPCICC